MTTEPEKMTDAQLNEAVAQEVMLWSYSKGKGWCDAGGIIAGRFTPATDATDAVRVLESFSAWSSDYDTHFEDKVFYEVSVWKMSNGRATGVVMGNADTFPRAACIAALKAVRSQP